MNTPQDLLEAFSNPAMRHAMLVHFPVVLSVIGIVFAALAAALGERSRALRFTALGVYLALVASSLTARYSGEAAEEAVEGSLSEAGHEELEAHEAHGKNVWLWPAGVSLLIGVSFLKPRAVRLGAGWIAVAVGILAADQIAHTADHGGRLVYKHGAAAAAAWGAQPAAGAPAALPDDPRVAFFREQVRPILTEHCLRCHNPRRAKRSGGLDQTTIAGLLTGGWGGPAIVPGRPKESLLIGAVRWDDPELKMPKSGDRLAEEQIAALEKWIADGAAWEAWELPADPAPEPREAGSEGGG